MSIDNNPSFLGQVLAWAAGGIAAVGAWLWVNTMGRIAAVEKDKIGREEFEAAMARSEKSRDELRESQQALFTQVDALRDHFDARFDKLVELIRSKP